MNELTNIHAIAPLRGANVIDFASFREEVRLSRAPRGPLVAHWTRVPATGELVCRWSRTDGLGEGA